MTNVFASPGTFPLPTLTARRADLSEKLVESVSTKNVVLVHGAEGVGKSVLINLCRVPISEVTCGPLLIVTAGEGWTIGSCLLSAGHLLEESGTTGAVALLGSPDRTPANGIRALIGLVDEKKATPADSNDLY